MQHDTAAFDDVTVVAQGQGHSHVRVLLDQQNGQPLLTVDGRDGREQLFGDIRRQSDRRLVEHEKLRPCDQGSADQEHLHFAARRDPVQSRNKPKPLAAYPYGVRGGLTGNGGLPHRRRVKLVIHLANDPSEGGTCLPFPPRLPTRISS